MSEVIREELQVPAAQVAVISGPNLALEIAREEPTASVVSSENLATATLVAMAARTDYLRSFVNTDVIGTEFGGVLKNLIATCESPLSRNNTAGRLLGQGYAFQEVIAQMNQTAEGLGSVAPILELAGAKGVEMPIVSQVAEVLAGTLDPRDIAPHLTTDTIEPQGE
jgi:glycerol-3-phosphate dehydrogenase (NAD(P)+)